MVKQRTVARLFGHGNVVNAESRASHEQVTSKLCTNQNQIKAVREPQQGSPPFIDSQEKTLGLIRLGGSFALLGFT